MGAGDHIAAPGEWRTNISIRGSLEPVRPRATALATAADAMAAICGDLMGVDLAPDTQSGIFVLEVNGMVDFDRGARSTAATSTVRSLPGSAYSPKACGASA